MKLRNYVPLFLLALFCCKKDVPNEESESQKLTRMKANIINNWKISKIMTVKPVSEYGSLITNACISNEIFSFKSPDSLIYFPSPNCSSGEYIRALWSLPKSDSLFIRFLDNTSIGSFEKLEVTKLTADTMKWNIVSTTSIPNHYITLEYTLIPK